MKSVYRLVMAVFLAGLLAAPSAFARTTPMVPASFADLAKEARPGVVNIQTVKTIKGGGRVFQHFFGSPTATSPDWKTFSVPF